MEFIKNLLSDAGLNQETTVLLSNLIMIIAIVILCMVANFITKKIVLRLITNVILKNRFKWDNIFLERRIFEKLSHVVPAMIIYSMASTFPNYQKSIEKLSSAYLIIIVIIVLMAVLDAADDIYKTYEVSKVKPIKGFMQVAKIIMMTIGIILVIANLIGQSPIILLSGLGALSAVLLIVFKDSLLGLVAGIQLASNDMLRVGDWVEMPKYHANGDVIDITLNTVKITNFDKTITMIPAYAFISDSFINWRGMQSAGGRRIKRAIYIDTTSITFCTKEMTEAFLKIHYLTDYILDKQKEIDKYNEENKIDRGNNVNGRQMTNVGVFRAYILNYLKNHSKIHQDMTLIVRQLTPGEYGLPLEIYAFTNDTNWTVYEGVQADIFDHIFAIAPSFGIRIFQNPAGSDLRSLTDRDVYPS